MNEEKDAEAKALQKLEGLGFTEAKLTSKKRKKLPASAFCGPKKSYPAHDAAHVRNALARLSQFGGKLKPAVRKRIISCLKRRAKRFGIEIGETVAGKLVLAKYDETLPKKEREKLVIQIEETLAWFNKQKEGEK